MSEIRVGQSAEKSLVVTDERTAVRMGSGNLSVFATPALVALMEGAAVAALAPLLQEGQSSVGTAISIRHLAATPPGVQVRARAEITAVEGRQVTFTVQAWDSIDMIGEGTHTRMVIDAARFLARVDAKHPPE